MSSSRTRAFVLLIAAFLCGGAVGGFVGAKMTQRQGWPGGRGMQSWMRALDLTAAQADTINAIWRPFEDRIDSLTKARIGAQKDSLWGTIKPSWDSLYSAVRPAIDSLRRDTRIQTRAALPENLRARYDSIVAAADSSRRAAVEQRNARSGNGRGGPGGGPNGGPGGPGRGGPGRSGVGPPGGGHGLY